ncbi:MAG: hypothetical protein K6T30_05485 [Alicyclobacillus sp.]|nr:hypothetical protein [Alicyclobacillus sp.]
MCGIAGLLVKRSLPGNTTGGAALQMLRHLCRRGPDSAGVALAHRTSSHPSESERCPSQPERWYVGVHCESSGADSSVIRRLEAAGRVSEVAGNGQYLRAVVDSQTGPAVVQDLSGVEGVSVASVGQTIEVLKCLGSADGLDDPFRLSGFDGPAVIGHTRMATESRVDISHSQPLTAVGVPDLAIVHNGHITNYVRLRQRYEAKGYVFQTDNDSEVIAVLLADCMREGADLADAMRESVRVLDGSFTYLALTPGALGLAREPFGMKPVVIAETDDYVALASESVAIQSVFDCSLSLWEPQVEEVRVWRF